MIARLTANPWLVYGGGAVIGAIIGFLYLQKMRKTRVGCPFCESAEKKGLAIPLSVGLGAGIGLLIAMGAYPLLKTIDRRA